MQSRVTIRDAEAQFPLHNHTISKEEVTMALDSQFLLGLVKSWVTEAETKDRVASSLWCHGRAPCELPGGNEAAEHAEPRVTVHLCFQRTM